MLCEGVSCPLLAGTASFLPWMAVIARGVQTHHTYRPLPGHRASNMEDLAKDAVETLLLVHLIKSASVLVPEWAAEVVVEGERERKELTLWWRPNEHQQLSGVLQFCPFLTKVSYLKWVKDKQDFFSDKLIFIKAKLIILAIRDNLNFVNQNPYFDWTLFKLL